LCGDIDWSHHSHLTSITSHLDSSAPQHRRAYILGVLAQITSHHMQTIKVLIYRLRGDLDVIDWDGIKCILKRPNYWYLQRFVVAGPSKPVLDATNMDAEQATNSQ
jgi:hypothetical protein